MEKERNLFILNKYANTIISKTYPEIDKIVINLIDNRYLEYNVYLNVDMDKDEVEYELDPLYLVDVNILKDVKSFLPDLDLPTNYYYNIIIYNNNNKIIFNWMDDLEIMYNERPSSTGGYEYRQLKGI